MYIYLDKNTKSVAVTSDNCKIVSIDDFPVNDLKAQLCSWLETVTEENAECFIFSSTNKEMAGAFRIEPRADGWQFTSTKETSRSSELLTLGEWKSILQTVL